MNGDIEMKENTKKVVKEKRTYKKRKKSQNEENEISNLLTKYAGVPMEELQKLIPPQEYVKIYIQKFLAESPIQDNPKNNILPDFNISPMLEKKENNSNIAYMEEIKKIAYSFGIKQNINNDCASILLEEFKRYITSIIISCSQLVGDEKDLDNGIEIKYINLDILSQIFYPQDPKSIRRIEYIVASMRRYKILKSQKNGSDDISEKNIREIDDEKNGNISQIFSDGSEKFYLNSETWHPTNLNNDTLHHLDEIHKEKLERLTFRDTLTKNMNKDEYIEFEQCCRTTVSKPRKKFLSWIKNSCELIDKYKISFDKEVLDVMGYLAHYHIELIASKVRSLIGEKTGFFHLIKNVLLQSIEEVNKKI